MRTIKELVASNKKRVYVYLADKDTQSRFISDAEAEGCTYEDGVKISEREPDDFYALNKDGTVCFLNFVGRMAFQCNSDNIVRVDYKKYINGEEDYFYSR